MDPNFQWIKKLRPVTFSRIWSPEPIGDGASGSVYDCKTNSTGDIGVAAKFYEEQEGTPAHEFAGFRKLHPADHDWDHHKGFLTVYGLVRFRAEEGAFDVALLMKRMHADGHRVFAELRSLVTAGRIGEPDYAGAVQLVARRTTKAIQHAQSVRMTLGDVKPSNLLFELDAKARSVIADLDSWSDDDNKTYGGTSRYRPPAASREDNGHVIGYEPTLDMYTLGISLSLHASRVQDDLRDDFVRRLTHEVAGMRLDATQALRHEYLRKQTGPVKQRSIDTLLTAIRLAGSTAGLGGVQGTQR